MKNSCFKYILALPLMPVAIILYPFANYIKPIQKFYCEIIEWHCHSKDYQFLSANVVNTHCKCKWCGYEGIVDSQGNLC